MRQKWFRELLRRRIFIIIMLVIQGAALILFIFQCQQVDSPNGAFSLFC